MADTVSYIYRMYMGSGRVGLYFLGPDLSSMVDSAGCGVFCAVCVT